MSAAFAGATRASPAKIAVPHRRAAIIRRVDERRMSGLGSLQECRAIPYCERATPIVLRSKEAAHKARDCCKGVTAAIRLQLEEPAHADPLLLSRAVRRRRQQRLRPQGLCLPEARLRTVRARACVRCLHRAARAAALYRG